MSKDHDIVKNTQVMNITEIAKGLELLRRLGQLERETATVKTELADQRAQTYIKTREKIKSLSERLQIAYARIKTLTTERDEARRMYCNEASDFEHYRKDDPPENGAPEDYARNLYWDCFKQDNWPSTKDRSEPDAEPQSPEA